jgi:solute carrier family 35 protein E1
VRYPPPPVRCVQEGRGAIIKDTAKWYGWTVVYNIYNKKALEDLDVGFVTASQLAFSTFMTFTGKNTTASFVVPKGDIVRYIIMLIILSFGQYFGNHFGNVATRLMSISSVNIIKSSEPILTMGVMFLLFRQRQQLAKIALIFPIVFGICLCNMSDVSYTHMGALMCTVSNLFHIFKIIASKKYFVEVLGYHGEALYILSNLGSFVIGVPILLQKYTEMSHITFFNLILSSFGYYYNSMTAFDLITKINPVTFSMLNIYKRVVITGVHYILAFKFPTFMAATGLLISNIGLYLYMK